MVICAVIIALQPRRPFHTSLLSSQSAGFRAGASSRRFRPTDVSTRLLAITNLQALCFHAITNSFARRRFSKLFSFNPLRTLSVATGVLPPERFLGRTNAAFDCGLAEPMRSRQDTALANRGKGRLQRPASTCSCRSTTYNIGALPFIGPPSTAARLHPTGLLPFTQHSRGASAPASRMS